MGGEMRVTQVSSYGGVSYPHRDSAEGQAATRSLGGKLGAALAAGLLGAVLVGGCGRRSDSGRRVPGQTGPPPVRADFKTEDDAKRKLDEQKELDEQKKDQQGVVAPPPARPDPKAGDAEKQTNPKE
jgi:hypothetical protein